MQTKEERQKMLEELQSVRNGIDDLGKYKELQEFFSTDQKRELWKAFCNLDLALDLFSIDPAYDPIEDEEA